jgi:putative Holliday junction resolvase
MNYLGIDWGKSKIGLATGSDELKIASPFKVLKYQGVGQSVGEIDEIIREENVEKVIIGKPVSLEGEENLAEAFYDFVKTIQALGVEVELEDERLTTKMSQRLTLAEKRKIEDDQVAAMLILQSYFDRM